MTIKNVYIFILASFAGTTLFGCRGAKSILDVQAFEQSEKVGYLLQRLGPTYDPDSFITNQNSEKSPFEQIREQKKKVVEAIKQTYVDRFFKDSFVREMNYRIPGELHSLDNNIGYINPRKKEDTDAVSLAKAQGCDIVIDLWVYPMMVRYRSYSNNRFVYASSVQAGLIATRISDGQVLWSQKTGLLSNTRTGPAPNYKVFPTLAKEAVSGFTNFYDQKKNIFIEKDNSKK